LVLRFYIDPTSGEPHIYNHGVAESEVEEIVRHPIEDRRGNNNSRIALGKTADGRYLKVIFVPDPSPNSIFVITAFDLVGKPLAALKRRKKRK